MMKAVFFIIFLSVTGLVYSATNLCRTETELKSAIQKAVPGDTIMLANKFWTNIGIQVSADGCNEAPVVLCSETFGKVLIEGESYLMIWGSYLVVDGLIFRKGFSPKSSVIYIKKSSQQVANNCGVTNCVIGQFSRNDRFEKNYRIAFFGKNIRLGHCYFAGKLNYGSTIGLINSELNKGMCFVAIQSEGVQKVQKISIK